MQEGRPQDYRSGAFAEMGALYGHTFAVKSVAVLLIFKLSTLQKIKLHYNIIRAADAGGIEWTGEGQGRSRPARARGLKQYYHTF